MARVTSLHKDIAYAMASPDVRILAPIPGRPAIGVEVPNASRQVVALGDILAAEEARRPSTRSRSPWGATSPARSVMANLADLAPRAHRRGHRRGQVELHQLAHHLDALRTTPDQVRLILVDPKRVELGQYNLPHLLTEVVTNPKKAANALAWAVREMERRYDLLAEIGVRDITGYNAIFDRGDSPGSTRPSGEARRATSGCRSSLIVVDELNDLMMVAARDVEDAICRIAQMARAVGIHLVIATQRPSVDVITGVIKANVPTRLAFSVQHLADSRVILDQPGRREPHRQGDMLLLDRGLEPPQRIQGALGRRGVRPRGRGGHWQPPGDRVDLRRGCAGRRRCRRGRPRAGAGPTTTTPTICWPRPWSLWSGPAGLDLDAAAQAAGRLRPGGRLMDLLEQRGAWWVRREGSKARAVLMTPEELDAPQPS